MTSKREIMLRYKDSIRRGIKRKCACGKEAYKWKLGWVCKDCDRIELDGYDKYTGTK